MNGALAPAIVVRVAAPAALCACAAAILVRGANALPDWASNLAARSGIPADPLARAVLGGLLLAAAVGAVGGRLAGGVARGAAAALALSGIAGIGAILGRHGAPVRAAAWIAPCMLVGAGATLLAACAAWPGSVRAKRPVRAWDAILGLSAATAAFAFAGRVYLPTTVAADPEVPAPAVLLDPQEWIGRTIPETGLSRLVPAITPATLTGERWIVIHAAGCERCERVFERFFRGPQGGRTVALRVPPAAGDGEPAGDQPAPPCEGCELLALPTGVRWTVIVPTVIAVQDGRVTCVSQSDYERCAPPASTASP